MTAGTYTCVHLHRHHKLPWSQQRLAAQSNPQVSSLGACSIQSVLKTAHTGQMSPSKFDRPKQALIPERVHAQGSSLLAELLERQKQAKLLQLAIRHHCPPSPRHQSLVPGRTYNMPLAECKPCQFHTALIKRHHFKHDPLYNRSINMRRPLAGLLARTANFQLPWVCWVESKPT